MLTKYDIPNHLKLNIDVPVEELRADFQRIKQLAMGTADFVSYTDSYVIDLTYLDASVDLEFDTPFAGSGTNRANANAQCNRLDIGKQTDPKENDKNHNRVKYYAEDSFTINWLRSLGDVAKVTYATLKPGGWWPTHYDFQVTNACKINIPLYTNEDAVSLSWNQREKKLHTLHIPVGDVYLTNTGFKHTGFNWGDTERTFILVTFKDQDILKYADN